MADWIYLWMDLLCLVPVFAVSFDKWVRYNRDWKYVLLSALIVALPFLAWDIWFTKAGFWGFNQEYLMGVSLFELPLEEISFFIVVPFACLLIYRTAEVHFIPKMAVIETKWLFLYGGIALMLIGVINYTRTYTLVNFVLGGGLMLFFFFKSDKEKRFLFSVTYVIHLVFFISMNGVLTGMFTDKPVVWYNDNQNLGIRLSTIPIEDLIYSFSLLAGNVLLFERFRK